MADNWIRPDSCGGDGWDNPQNAGDGDENTYSSCSQSTEAQLSPDLIGTFNNPVLCDKVRVLLDFSGDDLDAMHVDVYVYGFGNGAWYSIGACSLDSSSAFQWRTFNIPDGVKSIEKLKVNFSGQRENCLYVYEMDANKVAEAAAGYTLLYRGDDINAIDFDNILAVGDIDAGQIQTYLNCENGVTIFYVVRRANDSGELERTFSAAVKVSIDSNGNLAPARPSKIFEIKARQVAGNKVQLVWFYNPLGQKSKPQCFKVYYDGGNGQIDYENPVAAINYAGSRFYSFKSATLNAGTYLFAVKAEDAAGMQSPPTEIKVQVNSAIAETITILEARVI